ncbi:MAG: uroporphyrinogen decarboxylase, partial [Anaerolineales bacterium]|nr:uroporphyrinogen decarboxylase [Anaerolineales bacterium]
KFVLSHHCGSMAEVMDDVIEIGLDVYESVQPEAKDNNPYELKQRYGDRITFWGGLGSQSTLPFGTPAAIRAEVERLCTEVGRGGGFILAPSKAIQPGTPLENAAAMIEAFLVQAGVEIPR